MNKYPSINIKKNTCNSENVVLFVALLNDKGFREHINIYLNAWKRVDAHVVLIIQAESIRLAAASIEELHDLADEIWIRPNVGYDFSAWAEHIQRLLSQRECPSGRIYLTNDSVLGPLTDDSFIRLITRIQESSIDVIALTDNHDNGHHLQSYFLSLSCNAIKNEQFINFFSKIENKNRIDEVVLSYEIPLGAVAQDAGLTLSVVFPSTQSSDPTIFEASELIRKGYPFIKRKCLFSAKELTDTTELMSVVFENNCNAEIISYIQKNTSSIYNTTDGSISLFDLYRDHKGKVSDKWNIYLKTYDRVFSGIINKPLKMLEIGIQNGGSLEIWNKYFKNIDIIIGCDIDPRCINLSYNSPNISVIVGDANTIEIEKEILNLSKSFNLIIDDGSHTSADIVNSFCKFFPMLDDEGIYIIEDLHCSYFPTYEGGLAYEHSSIEFLKRLADIVNFEHWGLNTTRSEYIEMFTNHFSCSIDEYSLSKIHSVEFVNSICIIKKMAANTNRLGDRIIAGTIAIVDPSPLALKISG